jgi:hypothetical protein
LAWIRQIFQSVKQRTDIDKWQAVEEEVAGVGAEADTTDHHLDYSMENSMFRTVSESRLIKSH